MTDEKINQNIATAEKFNQNVVTGERCEKIWKSNRKIAMNKGLVQNNAMDEKKMERSVVDVKIDPKFVMDLFIFKVDGTNYSPSIKSHWKSSLLRTCRGCW